MEWLNYHHLFYFWTVAKEGSVTAACKRLRLAQPTISGQLRLLEENLGEKLFARAGRGIALTDVGHIVLRYADDIFGLGRELQDVLKGLPQGKPHRLVVGISDMIPKLVALRILQPVLQLPGPIKLVCEEDSPDHLIARLAEHQVDVVLSGVPLSSALRVRAYNHLLGSSSVILCGSPALAKRYGKALPNSLDGAPFLMPTEGSILRRSVDHWLESRSIRPFIVGEFKDSALLKAFGQAGAGLFAAPAAIENEIHRHYQVRTVGKLDGITENYYAISVERRLKNPAIVAICESARGTLLASK